MTETQKQLEIAAIDEAYKHVLSQEFLNLTEKSGSIERFKEELETIRAA